MPPLMEIDEPRLTGGVGVMEIEEPRLRGARTSGAPCRGVAMVASFGGVMGWRRFGWLEVTVTEPVRDGRRIGGSRKRSAGRGIGDVEPGLWKAAWYCGVSFP